MRDGLRKRFERLEAIRCEIERKTRDVDPALLNRRPAPNRWSVVQVMSHVAKAESLSVSYIGKKLSDPSNTHRETLGEWIKAILIVAVMRAPMRLPTPDVVAEVPDNDDPGAVRERWERARGEMRALLDSIPETLIEHSLYRHPVAGPMNVAHALAFMEAHAARHARQIDRVLAAITAVDC